MHTCLKNWGGSSRGMEGESGTIMIVDIPKVANCFPNILVKDDDGTITAKANPRQWTKEEISSKIFWRVLPCLNNTNLNIPDDMKKTYPSEKFTGKKSGYVFFKHSENGIGYHYDTHPTELTYSLQQVEPVSLHLQNDKGILEPDYEYLLLHTLAEPDHRFRNFGKDLKVLQKAPKHFSEIIEDLCVRLIKCFKYWYRQVAIKEFEEVKRKRHVPLLHVTGDHSKCDEEWYYALQAKREGKPYSEPPTNLIPGEQDKEIEQLLEIINKYTTDARIMEMLHTLDTQKYEAINNALALLEPKYKNFTRT